MSRGAGIGPAWGSALQRELVQTGKGLGGVINEAGARENSSRAGSKEEEDLGGCLDKKKKQRLAPTGSERALGEGRLGRRPQERCPRLGSYFSSLK